MVRYSNLFHSNDINNDDRMIEKDLNKKIEFEKFREEWKENWYDYYRLLDIDFEAFMLMKGLTIEEFKYLNNEELWKNML